jgi:hypothetical protein
VVEVLGEIGAAAGAEGCCAVKMKRLLDAGVFFTRRPAQAGTTFLR